MKFAISIFTTLVIIICAVLFIQYQVYSDKVLEEMDEYTYTQEIEVVYRGNSLDIRHHFKSLPNQSIKLTIPAAAQSVECFLETSSSCDRLALDAKSFEEGHARSQSISYVIPVEGDLSSDLLLKNVFAAIKEGEASYSVVHISTDSNVVGQWITGLPLTGQQQLKLVNYAMFSGEGQVKDLYYAANGATVQEISNDLTVYSNEPVSAKFKEVMGQAEMLSEEHLAVVQSSVKEQGYRMLFLPAISIVYVQNNMTLSQINTMYKFDADTPMWMKHMLATFLTGITFNDDKANAIAVKITEQMSDAQLIEWKARLLELKGNKITAKLLDEELSKVLQSPTNFLTKNNEVDYIHPFYFIDNRDILFNSKDTKQVEIIYYEGRMLYKAQSLLEILGYNAYEGENGYYVNNETRVFRFPNEPGFYVFNQRRYNTSVRPIIKLQNEYYIEENWLQRLFLVDLTKTEGTINIKTAETDSE